MKVCLLQSNPILGNLTQNFNWLKNQIKKQDADLFIAPEMALLGYPADDLISYYLKLCNRLYLRKYFDSKGYWNSAINRYTKCKFQLGCN